MLIRGCDKQLIHPTQIFYENWVGWRAGATTSRRKVKNFRGEQNDLERSAKDSESLVCKVSETL